MLELTPFGVVATALKYGYTNPMLTRRHFAKFAFVLAILLVWTQQLVAAHGVVHPFHNGGTQKQAPSPHAALCDLCVVSAMDSAPALVFSAPIVVPVHVISLIAVTASVSVSPLLRYHSRAPPILA